jgi:hypothetical protein
MKYEYLVKMSIDQLIPYFITQTIIVIMFLVIPLSIVYWIYAIIKEHRNAKRL